MGPALLVGLASAAAGFPVAGPALAGSRVVWASADAHGMARVRSAPAGGGPARTLMTFGRPAGSDPQWHLYTEVQLRASASRVVALRQATLFGPDRSDLPRFVAADVTAGPPGGPLARVAGCDAGQAGCRPECEPLDAAFAAGRLTWVRPFYGAGCGPQELRTESGVVVAGRRIVRLRGAGPYLAWEEPVPGSFVAPLVVYDVARGAEAYRTRPLQREDLAYALGEDGTLLAAQLGRRYRPRHVIRFDAAAPAGRPTPLRLDGNAEYPALALARGQVVYEKDHRLRLTRLGAGGGRVIARFRGAGSRRGSVVFDGRRVAWGRARGGAVAFYVRRV